MRTLIGEGSSPSGVEKSLVRRVTPHLEWEKMRLEMVQVESDKHAYPDILRSKEKGWIAGATPIQ